MAPALRVLFFRGLSLGSMRRAFCKLRSMSARYHAPAVAYPFSRPRWAAGALLLVWLCLLASLLTWCLHGEPSVRNIALAGGSLLAAALLLRWQWHQWPRGRLLWNGEYWQVEDLSPSTLHQQGQQAQQTQALHVGLDGGQWLWLQIYAVNRPKSMLQRRGVLWIFITQHDSPAQWGDLRRAVYSSVVPLAEQG